MKKQYDSRFEERFHKKNPKLIRNHRAKSFKYVKEHTYFPDFFDEETNTIFETKGRLTPEDRAKMIAVKAAHPDLDIVLIFQTPGAKISKRSKTTYKEWAEKHGFKTRKVDNDINYC